MIKEQILATIDDLVADLMYYDRKEDPLLPRGAIEKALTSGEITTAEMADRFRAGLEHD